LAAFTVCFCCCFFLFSKGWSKFERVHWWKDQDVDVLIQRRNYFKCF
jgi:hypothetical protein